VIALVTDSASQITPELQRQLGVEVVAVSVHIDGTTYREGIDLDADGFWRRFPAGSAPEVTTSQPSPGAFARLYEAEIERGAEAVVSVHVGAAHSGIVNSARLGAEAVDVDVHVVDTGTASFGVAACVWAAADVRAAGASAHGMAEAARATATTVGTSFILDGLGFARAGGRFGDRLPDGHDDVVVLSGVGSDLDVVGSARRLDDLCAALTEPFLSTSGPTRAAVCLADPATLPLTERLEETLRRAEHIVDVVRYRVGPSIAAHTGPGTAGGFWWPVG